MTNYFGMYVAPYGTSVKSLGEHENFDGADEEASKQEEDIVWIFNEEDLRGFVGSAEKTLREVEKPTGCHVCGGKDH